MKMTLVIMTMLTACIGARAQVAPAATGSDARLVYDVRYSQTVQIYGSSQSTVNRSVASGELEYLNGSEHKPQSITYSGGDMWAIGGSTSGTGVFQHFLLSQGFVARDWSLTLSDNVSYLPQSPITGFSGIPGVGDLPGVPGPPSQPILLDNTRSVYNDSDGNYTHRVGSDKDLGFSGRYGIMRFPDGNGLEFNQMQLAPHLNWRLNPLNSASVQYAFARFTYPGSTFSMGTQTAQFGYFRTWSRRLKTNASLGPEWIDSSSHLLVPSSTALSANASLEYQARSTSWFLNYYRATSAGVGTSTQLGIRNDDVSASAAQTIGRDLSLSATASYLRTQGLVQTGVTTGIYVGVQAQQRLGQRFTLFANYTVIKQTSSLRLPSNAISGWSQVFGFGIGYNPRDIRIKR
jgi:hypothetical protein